MSVTMVEQANELNAEGKYEEAAELYDQLLTQNHANPDLLATLATILLRNSKTIGLAITLFHYAIDRYKAKGKSINTEVYCNLGLAYKYSGQVEQAEKYLKMAVDSGPSAGALANYGCMFVESGKPGDGLPYLEQAVKLDPSMALAHWNLSLCLLEQAHPTDCWGRAWDEYEWGQIEGGMRIKKKHVDLPDWDGVNGKKLIVYGEQGIGDEIMFASMLAEVAKHNEVILDCHPRLATLFERNFNVKCYPTRKDKEMDWIEVEKPDAMIALGSLGKFYRRKKSDFTGEPYLQSESAPKGNKFRVGISWTGGRLTHRVARRTVPLSWWKSIFNNSDCEFVSLQYTDCADEIAIVEKEGYKIEQFEEIKAYDYYETAKIVASCDLVISVCTSVVHMAGALGVPTWVMTPNKPAWRYQTSGPMPWYRSVRLYRQPQGEVDAWIPVVQKIGYDLEQLLSERRHSGLKSTMEAIAA